jgi:nucleoside-diphosphate-sugar epimerase
MNVLVTGCAGYIGSVLNGYLLEAGYNVIGVDNLRYDNQNALLPYLGHKNFCFHRLDIQGMRALQAFIEMADAVIPLAALVGAPLCEKNTDLAYSVNEWAVKDMVQQLNPGQRIVFPNTNSGYGQTDGDFPCTEEDPLTPISVYGHSKCNAERAVLKHQNSVVFRLATVCGASPRMRMDLMVNDFTEKIVRMRESFGERTKPFSIFEPHFKRNFVHIRDVCRAFVYALKNRKMEGVYNLGDPSANMTKMELAHEIADVVGAWKDNIVVGDGKDPDKRNYVVSSEKILNTGFAFAHSIKDAITEVEAVCMLFPSKDTAKMRNV